MKEKNMRKIIPFLLFLAAITISCSREPSVLNIKIDDKTESTYYRVILKGEDEKFENLIYKDTIAYPGLRCGIYTLEVVSYGDYDLSSYAVKTVRIDEGINNETITLEKEDREDHTNAGINNTVVGRIDPLHPEIPPSRHNR